MREPVASNAGPEEPPRAPLRHTLAIAIFAVAPLLLSSPLSGGEPPQSRLPPPVGVPTVVDTIRPSHVDRLPYVIQELFPRFQSDRLLLSWSVADLDADGWDEMVTAEQQPQEGGNVRLMWYDFTDGQPFVVHQENVLHFDTLNRDYGSDLNGDGATDVAISLHRESEAWGRIYGFRGSLLAETPRATGPDLSGSGQWDGSLIPVAADDLNGDGRRDLLCHVRACYDREPRGLLAYDLYEQDSLWFFHAGPFLNTDGIFQLTNPADRERMFLLSTYSPSNLSFEGGIPDTASYLFLLNDRGEELRRFKVGGPCTDPQIVLTDLDDDGRNELVMTMAGNLHYPGIGSGIWILDPFTFEVKHHVEPGALLGAPCVGDVDRDNRMEIVTHSPYEVLVYDAQLNLKTRIPSEVKIGRCYIYDATNDGRPDIVLVLGSHNAIAVVSPRSGRITAYREFESLSFREIVPLVWGPGRQIFFGMSGSQPIGLFLKPSAQAGSDGSTRGGVVVRWPTAVAVMGAALVLGMLLAAVLLIRRTGDGSIGERLGMGRRHAKSGARASEFRAALTQLTALGHGEPGAVLARAATLLQAANADLVADREWCRTIVDTQEVFQRTVPAAVTNLLEFNRVLQSAGTDPREVGRLSQEIDAEFARFCSIMKTGAVLEAAPMVELGIKMREFDEILRGSRVSLRNSFHCDVVEVVQGTLATKRQVLRESGVTDVGFKLQGEGPWVAQMDGHRLQYEVLDDLITNSARAMHDSPRRVLDIEIRQEEKVIHIRVRDSGRGIPVEIRRTVFNRGVSSRPDGGGLGLYQARSALKDFGGRVAVEDSSEQAGTSILVSLSVAEAGLGHPV